MNRIKFIFAIVLLLSISCSQETEKHNLIPIYIEPDKVIDVYDIAGDVEEEWEIFPLETTDDCLISQIVKIIFQNGKYYVLDTQMSSVTVFDATGKFLRKLNRKGQGPGEYISIVSFDVIGDEVWISDINRRRLMVYDSLFNYIEEIGNLSIAAFDMNHAGQNVYMASNWFSVQAKNCQLSKYSVSDKKLNCMLEVGSIGQNNISVSKNKTDNSIWRFLHVLSVLLQYAFSNKEQCSDTKI